MKLANMRRWIVLLIISVSGGVSFDLAYLRFVYQIPMVEHMGFTNMQVGLIMSTFGMSAILFYAPSGIIADKFSHKYMMTGSMLATGLLGLLMSTFPSFEVMIAIQFGFAITTILTLWSVTLKAASLLGSFEEQGAIMGWMEGMRGIGVMVLALLTMWVFTSMDKAGASANGLRSVILIYSIVYIALAALCWIFVDHGYGSEEVKRPQITMQDILGVLARKTTWLCSAIVMGVYSIYAILSYSTNYLVEHYGMNLATASFIGVLINKVFRAICGPAGGLITTYSPIKSSTRVLRLGAILSLATIMGLIFLNRNPQSVGLAIGLILVVTFVCMASRGLYWATIGEVKTPLHITGTTIGVVSVLGFLPDIFVYPVVGHWQDTLPAEQAYQNMWLMAFAAMSLVVIATTLLYREIRQQKSNDEQSEAQLQAESYGK
ncbi:membrane protein [Photobacterium gaetbulicola]|uniref:Membrane protein n=1 Tax=Photobacterium gaetbulicola TaxID=1295392 RepID=A0A0B9GXA6_9GAMM|nr:MFS transporter [Photobacterium gaetbulicola]KHT63366.1 membrane protein [Photobacterium gaetbulicola]